MKSIEKGVNIVPDLKEQKLKDFSYFRNVLIKSRDLNEIFSSVNYFYDLIIHNVNEHETYNKTCYERFCDLLGHSSNNIEMLFKIIIIINNYVERNYHVTEELVKTIYEVIMNTQCSSNTSGVIKEVINLLATIIKKIDKSTGFVVPYDIVQGIASYVGYDPEIDNVISKLFAKVVKKHLHNIPSIDPFIDILSDIVKSKSSQDNQYYAVKLSLNIFNEVTKHDEELKNVFIRNNPQFVLQFKHLWGISRKIDNLLFLLSSAPMDTNTLKEFLSGNGVQIYQDLINTNFDECQWAIYASTVYFNNWPFDFPIPILYPTMINIVYSGSIKTKLTAGYFLCVACEKEPSTFYGLIRDSLKMQQSILGAFSILFDLKNKNVICKIISALLSAGRYFTITHDEFHQYRELIQTFHIDEKVDIYSDDDEVGDIAYSLYIELTIGGFRYEE